MKNFICLKIKQMKLKIRFLNKLNNINKKLKIMSRNFHIKIVLLII